MERRDASAGRRAAAGMVGAAALALALTGCGAGQQAETSRMQTAISGVDVDAGTLALRDLQVDYGDGGFYPEGGQAPLRVWIGNQGEETVFLESVSSPDAEAVILAAEVVAVEDEASESPEADEASESPEADDASASPSAEGSATPGEDASASAEGEEVVAEIVGESVFTVEIPPGDYVRLTPTTGSFLLLDGLNEDLGMGSRVELEFAFSNGENVTITVPMGVPDTAGDRSYFGDPHEPAAE
ncbi:hypothetical protein [Glycomyces dulcitolivorans]|uniref:hypothetical protein n=1 Tax=Glycomyces dulcitolivorans TaxID=2200759 RepID=UPI00130067E6|nr:hypothetical protein [Glycomyces dulcitolivorans]